MLSGSEASIGPSIVTMARCFAAAQHDTPGDIFYGIAIRDTGIFEERDER